MSLRSLAATDAQALIDLDGEDIVLTYPTVGTVLGAVYTVSGIYVRRGVSQSADGLMVKGDSTVVTVSLGALADAGLADPETLRTTQGITVSAAGVAYRLDSDVLLDRTLGVATMFLKRTS